jgi:hypothetical protein
MSNLDLKAIEIYPNILVYKNLFKDIAQSYKILTDSLLETEDRLFSPWTKWSVFGDYLNPPIPNFDLSDRYGNIKNVQTKTKTQENEKNLIIEMMENFHLVTEDYIKRYSIDVDLNATSVNEDGNIVPTWRCTGGTIGKYNVSTDDYKIGMNYHSDYIRESGSAPGYKFVITCTIYFNDDYEGGEVDFAMGDKFIKYKPEAGDLLVFPSGHPDYLTENGKPYLHGVMPSYNKNKFLSRLYWEKYQKGTDLWYEKQARFGKDVWYKMQNDLRKQFMIEHPQKPALENNAESGVKKL